MAWLGGYSMGGYPLGGMEMGGMEMGGAFGKSAIAARELRTAEMKKLKNHILEEAEGVYKDDLAALSVTKTGRPSTSATSLKSAVSKLAKILYEQGRDKKVKVKREYKPKTADDYKKMSVDARLRAVSRLVGKKNPQVDLKTKLTAKQLKDLLNVLSALGRGE